MHISQEELTDIRDSIFLPMLLNVVENTLRKVEKEPNALKPLFIASTQSLMQTIHRDLVSIKNKLRAAQIKVWEMDRAPAYLNYKFICRGYQDEFGMMKELVKAELGVRLADYVKKLTDELTKKYNTLR